MINTRCRTRDAARRGGSPTTNNDGTPSVASCLSTSGRTLLRPRNSRTPTITSAVRWPRRCTRCAWTWKYRRPNENTNDDDWPGLPIFSSPSFIFFSSPQHESGPRILSGLLLYRSKMAPAVPTVLRSNRAYFTQPAG